MLYRWGRENSRLGIKVNSVKIIDIINISLCNRGFICCNNGRLTSDEIATRVEKYKVKEQVTY